MVTFWKDPIAGQQEKEAKPGSTHYEQKVTKLKWIKITKMDSECEKNVK